MIRELGPGRARAAVLLRLVNVRTDDMPALIALSEQALIEAEDDLTLRWWIHQTLASYCLWHHGPERAHREAEASVECAERAADFHDHAVALATLGYVDELAGRPRGADFWDLAIAVEDRASAPFWWSPRLAHGVHLMFRGLFDEARPLVRGAGDRAAAIGHQGALSEIEFWLAELERRAGNWQTAFAHAETSLELCEEAELEHDQAVALYGVAMVEAHLGLAEAARAHAEAGLAYAQGADDVMVSALNHAALGFLELSLGHPASAAERLSPLAELLESMGFGEPSFPPVLPDAVEALIAAGR